MARRKKKTNPTVWMLSVIIGLIIAGVSLWWEERNTPPVETAVVAEAVVAESSSEAMLNEPADETLPYELAQVMDNKPEQVIEHVGYTVSYNPEWHVPNWVAWELTNQESSGDEKRSNHFVPDPLVEGDPVVTKDYSGSGYDRGHMAPAGDMKWSEQAMRESFYMTNMCPQLHNLNAGDWKSLEDLERDWAQAYGNIYITCGPIVDEPYETIGNVRKIAIPSAFYKVFLRQKGDEWTSIGFVMPHVAGTKPLLTYLSTVNEIEDLTGIDFFYLLPDEVEEQVEAMCEVEDWSLSRH